MPATAPTRNNTCAVIVTYHPDVGFSSRLECVLAQFLRVIIVDNGSNATSVSMLNKLADLPHVYLVMNQKNLGIAAALNQGVKLASKQGMEWIVTLDQDTVLFPNMLATLLEVHEESGCGNVMIGSNYREVHRKKDFIKCKNKPREPFLERKTLITSGTLIPVSLFEAIGLFREDYFIDSVDHEFCLRARAHGCRILISCQPVMSHSIGSQANSSGRIRQLLSFHHSPLRKYFIARNTIATVKSYFLKEPLWSMRQGWRLLSDFVSILLFESEKMKKATAFMVGVSHGISGKMGSIEQAWPNGSH